MDMKQKAVSDYMTYASAVIKSRAIPLMEDGLKPVQRRVLWSMKEMKLGPKAKTVKSATVVGKTLLYHPHGDSSVYGALVRMSQDWKVRYPLTYIQGNNGSLNGDGPAHMRYTECRLTDLGYAMLNDVDPEIVSFAPNYDNTTQEPTMLGGIFPNVLCNGTEGIAVGMSSSLVPHNLCNVTDLITEYIKNPSMDTDTMMSLIVGPDFPLGGIVVDGYKLADAYKTGVGTITLRAKAEIDNRNNTISFSEFPYLVDVQDKIITSIQHLVLDEGYNDIVDVENHIGKNSCYIKVILGRNANAKKVLADLYQHTPLEKTVKINNTVIHNGVPMTVSLLGLCGLYVQHRHNCIIKAAKKEKDKQDKIAHIQKGLLAATTDIDNVVALIRNSDSKEEARAGLMKKLGVDGEQADAILSLQLGRLTRLDINDIQIKIKNAEKESGIQANIIGSKPTREQMIIDALCKMKAEFGDGRRTTIVAAEPQKEEVKTDNTLIVDDHYQIHNVETSKVIDETKKGGSLAKINPIYWKRIGTKESIIYNKDGSTSDSWSKDSVGIIAAEDKEWLVTISKNGVCKKTAVSAYRGFGRLCRIKENDELFFAGFMNNDDSLLIRCEDKIYRYSVNDIKTLNKLTVGVKLSKSSVDDVCISKDYIYTLNADNQIKRMEIADLTSSAAGLNEGCIKIGGCDAAFYYDGKFNSIDWSTVCVKSRKSNGSRLSNKTINNIL